MRTIIKEYNIQDFAGSSTAPYSTLRRCESSSSSIYLINSRLIQPRRLKHLPTTILKSSYFQPYQAMSRGKMRRPSVYETSETSRAALPSFRNKRLLSLHKHRLQHLQTKGKTNLGGEGETKVEQGAEVVLIDSIIPHHVIAIARRLKQIRATDIARSQGHQRKTSVEYASRKVTTRMTIPCLKNSNLIILRRKIKVLLRQRKQGIQQQLRKNLTAIQSTPNPKRAMLTISIGSLIEHIRCKL